MILRRIFYKSRVLVVLYIAIAMLFILLGTAFDVNNKMKKPFNFLSDEYMKIVVYDQNTIKNEELTNFAKEEKVSYLISEEFTNNDGCAVAYSDNDDECVFDVDIVSGRGFLQDDFKTHRDVAIVASDFKSENIRTIKGTRVFEFNGNTYEIIGEFEKDSFSNRSYDWCISMESEKMQESFLYGEILYDTFDTDSEKLANNFISQMQKEHNAERIDAAKGSSEEGQEWSSSGTNFGSMIFIFVLTLFLVTLNSLFTCYFWITSRKREIGIRKMAGANRRKIVEWLTGEYMLILFFTFICGGIASEIFLFVCRHIPVNESVKLMFGTHISFKGVVAGSVLLCVAGIATVILSLHRFNKNQIVGIIKA